MLNLVVQKLTAVAWNELVSESVVYLVLIFIFGIVDGPNPVAIAC
jgi:hypothetical protein